MNGFMKRHSTPDWTLVALITKRGSSGMSCSVAPLNRCSSYAAALRSLTLPGNRTPVMMESASMVSPARPRSGVTTSGTKSALSRAGSKLSLPHFNASTPAVMEPPETLEIRFMLLSRPVS